MQTLTKNVAYQLQLASKPQSIIDLDNMLHQLLNSYQVQQSKFANIYTALNEAVTNAINHGNKLNPNKKVCISVKLIKKNTLSFTVTDEGEGFDVNNLTNPTLPQNIKKLTGRGVFLMQQLTHKCCFNTIGNKVEMQFLLP